MEGVFYEIYIEEGSNWVDEQPKPTKPRTIR